MPKLFIRRVFNPDTGRIELEVVDGQQRVTSILKFYRGDLRIRRQHNPEFADLTFAQLPEHVQQAFLTYKLSIDMIDDASDYEVWALFERLNTYTLTLNRQERLNARYFGYFKQSAYRLAAQESSLDTWRRIRVFSDLQIARMVEVEHTSDVLAAITEGIVDIAKLAEVYRRYDDDFPKQQWAEETFEMTLAYVDLLHNSIRRTKFRNRAWLYSLMVACADVLQGIPRGLGPGEIQDPAVVELRMTTLEAALAPDELPASLAQLKVALQRGTSHVPERRTRHRHFYPMLNMSGDEWHRHWGSLAGD